MTVLVLGLTGETGSTGLASLRRLLEKHKSEAGFSLRDLDGREVLEVSGKVPKLPASLVKTISSACALRTLGPEYQFETRFGMRGEDLIVSGSGDPSFVIENLHGIVDAIRDLHGIKEIKGSMIFDTSYFGAKSLVIASGFEGDEGRSFASNLTPFAFNHNSFGILVAPGSPKALVALAPSAAIDLKIQNAVQVVSGTSQAIVVDYRPSDKILSLKGSIGRDAPVRAFYRAVPDVYPSFARVFAQVWMDRGGVWKKPTYDFSQSTGAIRNLWTHSSQPVSRLLLDINKLSTNFGAELVSLAASSTALGRPATFSKLETWLNSCVRDMGVKANEMVLKNASGLSRETRVTASSLTQFLSSVSREDFFPEYLSSLSILGKDGTTKRRLKSMAGRGRLKTGSIKGVRSIAGYLYPDGKAPLSFALIFNNAKIGGSEIQDLENRIIEVILDSL